MFKRWKSGGRYFTDSSPVGLLMKTVISSLLCPPPHPTYTHTHLSCHLRLPEAFSELCLLQEHLIYCKLRWTVSCSSRKQMDPGDLKIQSAPFFFLKRKRKPGCFSVRIGQKLEITVRFVHNATVVEPFFNCAILKARSSHLNTFITCNNTT